MHDKPLACVPNAFLFTYIGRRLHRRLPGSTGQPCKGDFGPNYSVHWYYYIPMEGNVIWYFCDTLYFRALHNLTYTWYLIWYFSADMLWQTLHNIKIRTFNTSSELRHEPTYCSNDKCRKTSIERFVTLNSDRTAVVILYLTHRKYTTHQKLPDEPSVAMPVYYCWAVRVSRQITHRVMSLARWLALVGVTVGEGNWWSGGLPIWVWQLNLPGRDGRTPKRTNKCVSYSTILRTVMKVQDLEQSAPPKTTTLTTCPSNTSLVTPLSRADSKLYLRI